jgi:hypothetical protein
MRAVPRAAVVVAALCCATVLAAQQRPFLRGEVVHADVRTAAVAVLIEAVDATNGVAGRALTGQGGRFAIPLPAGRTYTVRALRVGYRPTVVSDVAVTDSGATIRIVLDDVAIRLNAARVTADDRCGVQSGAGGLIATAWEEVRKALASTDIAGARHEFQANVTNWYSVHAPDGNSPIWQDITHRTLDSPKPYVGVPASEVETAGYARPGPAGAVDYLGPDAETLTSSVFAMTHCFRLVPPQAGRPWLGVAFRPLPDRGGPAIVEIEGTFWVDTTSAALRLLEYRYTNAPPTFSRVGAGGRIEFDRLSSGEWLIRRWTIRLAMDVVQRRATENVRALSTPYVAASGGFVTSLEGGTTELLPPPARTWRAQFSTADATARLDGATVEFAEGGYFAVADATGAATVGDVPTGRHSVFASTALMRALTLPPIRLTAEVATDGGGGAIRVPGELDLLKQRCGAPSESRREAAVYGLLANADAPRNGGRSVAVAVLSDEVRETTLGQRWRADSLSLASGRMVNELGEPAIPDSFGRWVACGIRRGAAVRITLRDDQGRLAGVTYARVGEFDRIVEAGTLVIRAP